MVFKEVFAPFRELWAGTSTTVLPQHILEGKNFNKVWNNCICDPKTKKPISSGPMMVQSFTPDEQVTLVPEQELLGREDRHGAQGRVRAGARQQLGAQRVPLR